MDRKLPFHHRMAIYIHLMMCRYCVRFRRQLRLIRKMCRHDESSTLETSIPDVLTPNTRERIKASLRAHL